MRREVWTPYGLERIRRDALRRRRLRSLGAVVLLVGAAVAALESRPSRVAETRITIAGDEDARVRRAPSASDRATPDSAAPDGRGADANEGGS